MTNQTETGHVCHEICIAQWNGVCVADECQGPYLMHPFPKSAEQAKKMYWLTVQMFKEDFGGKTND